MHAERTRVERGIYKRTGVDGRVRFEIAFRDSDGRQRRQVVEGGLRAARSALADVKARMGRGQRVAPAHDLTFGDVAARWAGSQVAALRPATRDVYASHLRCHLLPRWGRRRLDSLSVDDVARLVEEMRVAGRRAWTIRGVLVVAGRVFDFARRRLDWAGENPVRALDRSERPRGDQRERRVLSSDELARLLDCADEQHRTVFAFAAGTGARLGEVLGLRWRCVDLDDGTATIDRQLDRRRQLAELKTRRSRRTLELPGSTVAALREHKLLSAYTRPDDLVFCSRTGTALDARNVAGRALARAINAAGLDGPDAPTFHSLRHGFASSWIASGGDLVELSAHLGHRDPAVTASVYSHEFERAARSDQRRARLDSIYGSDDGSIVAASERSAAQQPSVPRAAEVLHLRPKRDAAQ